MRIWIDLGNSPHVLLFRPIIYILESEGHTVEITACDFAQTTELAGKFKLNCSSIGSHGGGALHRKGFNLFSRSLALMRWAFRMDIDLVDFAFLGIDPIETIRLGVGSSSAVPSLVGAHHLAPVPLPLPLVLFSSGLALLGFVGRRRNKT